MLRVLGAGVGSRPHSVRPIIPGAGPGPGPSADGDWTMRAWARWASSAASFAFAVPNTVTHAPRPGQSRECRGATSGLPPNSKGHQCLERMHVVLHCMVMVVRSRGQMSWLATQGSGSRYLLLCALFFYTKKNVFFICRFVTCDCLVIEEGWR